MPDKPDKDSDPGTEAFVPDFGDDSEPIAIATPEHEEAPEPTPADTASEPESAPDTSVVSVTVPGRYHYLKWWKFVLVVLGVWVSAAPVGLGLFYWWFHTTDKTWPLFMVLVYVVACSLAGVLLAMVRARPMISALSIALMSGPLASLAAAAPLYGYYYCQRTGGCLLSVIPY